MPRWAEVVITLVLYGAAMWAVAWALKQTVPAADAWIVSGIGQGGAWALVIGVWLAAALYVWRDSRRRR
jgi:hypothetical protein